MDAKNRLIEMVKANAERIKNAPKTEGVKFDRTKHLEVIKKMIEEAKKNKPSTTTENPSLILKESPIKKILMEKINKEN